VQPNKITEVLNRPISQELLARDVTRLAYVTKDGTPRNVPIGFTWNGSDRVSRINRGLRIKNDTDAAPREHTNVPSHAYHRSNTVL